MKLPPVPVAGALAPTEPAPDDEAKRYVDDLRNVAKSLASAVDLKDILDRVVDGILRVARCERGYVMLRESNGAFSTYTGRQRDQGVWNEDDARRISSTIFNNVVATMTPFVRSDLLNFESRSIQEEAIVAAVCLPLLNEEGLIGVIYADSRIVTAPYTDVDRLRLEMFSIQAAAAVENAKRHGELKIRGDRLEAQNLELARQLAREFAMEGTISTSEGMLDVFDLIRRVAPDDLPVMLLGESGTGKGVLARAIHNRSLRAGRAFQSVNCGSIPSELVEGHLFGHVRGAFSGAVTDRQGVFEVADGGTVFLDEIGTMPFEAQSKLLRVLQDKEFERVGEMGRTRQTDVRIVSATNIDIVAAVKKGTFRDDLFFRLKGAILAIPALRDRKEDILPLAEHFLEQVAEEKKQPRARLSQDARALLLRHTWPGNVRELQTLIRGGVLLQDDDGVIYASALERLMEAPTRGSAPPPPADGTYREQIERLDEQIIRRAVLEHESNVTNMSKALGLSRTQLYNKFRKYGIAVRSE